jgi:hypothetical protein
MQPWVLEQASIRWYAVIAAPLIVVGLLIAANNAALGSHLPGLLTSAAMLIVGAAIAIWRRYITWQAHKTLERIEFKVESRVVGPGESVNCSIQLQADRTTQLATWDLLLTAYHDAMDWRHRAVRQAVFQTKTTNTIWRHLNAGEVAGFHASVLVPQFPLPSQGVPLEELHWFVSVRIQARRWSAYSAAIPIVVQK